MATVNYCGATRSPSCTCLCHIGKAERKQAQRRLHQIPSMSATQLPWILAKWRNPTCTRAFHEVTSSWHVTHLQKALSCTPVLIWKVCNRMQTRYVALKWIHTPAGHLVQDSIVCVQDIHIGIGRERGQPCGSFVSYALPRSRSIGNAVYRPRNRCLPPRIQPLSSANAH